MTTTIPAQMPDRLYQGTTIKWKIKTDYDPDDGWSVRYVFISRQDTGSPSRITITSTADNDYHLISISAAESAEFEYTRYHYQAYAVKDDEKYLVDSGDIEVQLDYETTTTGYDPRTHAQKMLDAIQSALEGRASTTQLSYSLPNGLSVSYSSPSDLIEWLDYYKGQVNKEQQGASVKQIKFQL